MLFATFTISAVKALQDLSDLNLNKQGKKCATLPNITAILNKNGVQIQEIPSDRVRFRKSTFLMVAVLSQQFVCVYVKLRVYLTALLQRLMTGQNLSPAEYCNVFFNSS